MRRKLAFSGFILGTCIMAITTFFMLIGAIMVADLLAGTGSTDTGAVIAVIVLEMLFYIAILILNALSISATTTASKFDRRKGLVITTIVFNFIAVFMYILSISVSGTGVGMSGVIVFYVIFMLALIASNVLAIVDLARNGTALEREKAKDNKEEVVSKVRSQEVSKDTDGLEEELNKLIAMKEKNLITDEEFAELKKCAIDKRL